MEYFHCNYSRSQKRKSENGSESSNGSMNGEKSEDDVRVVEVVPYSIGGSRLFSGLFCVPS